MRTGRRARASGGTARPSVARSTALVLAAALSLACVHTVERHDWSGYEGPGAQYFHAEEIDPPSFPDPLEPANRAISAANHVLIVYLASPLGKVYRFVIPRFVRDRVRDFSANLIWPRNLVANLLQAKWRDAGTETARFGINTTVGIAGLWDPAAYWWSIEPKPEDFGQVFGAWGWRSSTFLVLPLFGPSTVRDAIGLVPDTYLDPATYYFPASYVLAWNDLVDSIPDYELFVASSFDPYDDARIVWTLNRDEEIADGRPPQGSQGRRHRRGADARGGLHRAARSRILDGSEHRHGRDSRHGGSRCPTRTGCSRGRRRSCSWCRASARTGSERPLSRSPRWCI